MHTIPSRLTRVIEYLLLAAPFLILVPRTNTPADPLTPNSLPSHEFMTLLYATILTALVLIHIFKENLSPKFSRWQGILLLSLLLFCVWQGVTLLWAPDTSEGFRIIGNWFCLLTFVATGCIYWTEKIRYKLYISSTIVTIILASYQFFLFEQEGREVATGLLYAPYLKMELLALLIPLQVAVFITTKETQLQILTGISLVISCVVQMQLTKRTPLAGIFVALLIISGFILFKKLKIAAPRLFAIGTIVVLLISAFQVAYRWNEIKVKIFSATTTKEVDGVASSNLNDRVQRSLVGWEMFKAHVVKGIGVGGYPTLETDYRRDALQGKLGNTSINTANPYRQYEALSGQAHNEYAQIAGETGAIGSILILIFLGSLIFLFWKSENWSNSYSVGAFAGLISYAICSAFTSFSFRSVPGVVLVACVIIIGLINHATESEPVFSKSIWTGGIVLLLVAFSFLTWHRFSVMRCYQIEREAAFMYDLEDPDKNRQYLAEHQRALSWDSKNASANLGYGVMLYQMHQPETAVSHLEFAIKQGYNRPWTVSLLAFCLEQTRDFDKAISYLDECIAAFPKSIYAKSIRAEMLRKKGAIEEYKKQKDELVNNLEATVWDIALRNTNEKTDEEIKKLGVARLYDIGEPTGIPAQPFKLEQVLIQMRAFHYLK